MTHFVKCEKKWEDCPTALAVPIRLPGRSGERPGVSSWKAANHLAGILAALEEAGTDHAVGDLSRVRGFTLLLGQQWGIQALQQLRVVDFEEQKEAKERRYMSKARMGDSNPGQYTEGS